LSDIAAMGGTPVAAFLSLALPRRHSQSWLNGFIRGLLRLAEQFEVTLAGGDTTESPKGILADIVVVGFVPQGTMVLRSGARPGDRIYVTGELGGASAALTELLAGRKIRSGDYPRHFYPMPRVAQGRILREKRLASAMIDLSDGLSTDLAHICQESGVGAEILAESIPRANVGRQGARVDLQHTLHGGEDYELLFTAPSPKRIPRQIAGIPVTLIGRVTRRKKIVLVKEGGRMEALRAQGWEHFRK
jgi:thiamine-monophosphate kinase